MKSNTDVIWWYSQKNECAYCKKSIEFPNLSKCENCGELVCTNCAQYVAVYNVEQNKYDGKRVCKECEIPALTLAEVERLAANCWMKVINNNWKSKQTEVSTSV